MASAPRRQVLEQATEPGCGVLVEEMQSGIG